MTDDFVYIDEFVPGVRWDAKYATWDNFTGKPVDGYLANRVVGTRALGTALIRAGEQAKGLGFGLLIWDAYRPQRAVDNFIRWSKEPEDARIKARFHPNINRAEMFELGYVATKSGHSRGSTLDLTLFDRRDGALVAMGGDHDLMDVRSHHGAEGITAAETANRQTLRTIMEDSGFNAYEAEWWHYTLRDEPYPDTYFDFPITANITDTDPARVIVAVG
ncbi:D-Ala-D-Ala dipeptidase VanX [Dactylosporangium sp. NPDC051541]|uniref:D-Ala-D-Ala dipeptidase VanX n=1 Tax=Dactylosporangium sp. NPDC051541 TaxID=3363977 RepID=UPI0037BB9C9D